MSMRPLSSAMLFALWTASAGAGTIEIDSTDVPRCTTEQSRRWSYVVTEFSGIEVRDPTGATLKYMGSNGLWVYPMADGPLWRNWEPISGYKEAVCGTLSKYEFYTHWYGDERDANKYIIPDPDQAHLITGPIDSGFTEDPDEVSRCNGYYCMEGEIEHPSGYDSNPWFKEVDGQQATPIDGKRFCTYGPWVGDFGHKGRPEIHPSEAMWWRTSPTPSGLLDEHRVILMTDDSERFDERDDFDPDMPQSMEPWAGMMAANVVRIPFSFLTAQTDADYVHVYETPRTKEVTTSSNAALFPDATSGTVHSLIYNGNLKIVAVEHQPDSNLGVVYDETPGRFGVTDMCRIDSGYVLGYVTLRSQIGDSLENGYQELLIHKTETFSDPAAAAATKSGLPPPERQVVGGKIDWSTVRLDERSGRPRLVGDMMLELAPGSLLESVRDSQGRELFPEAAAAAKSVDAATTARLVDVDLSRGAEMSLRFADGKTMSGPTSGLALGAELSARPLGAAKDVSAADLDSAWTDLVRQLGAQSIPRPALFAATPDWTVEATPQFSPTKHGKPSREDALELAERLNELALEGKASPLPVGKAVGAVDWQVAGKSTARLEPSASAWERRLAFPTTGALQQAQVEIAVQDIFGGRSTEKRSVWSHGLVGEAAPLAAALRVIVAGLSGVDEDTLFETGAKSRDDVIEEEYSWPAKRKDMLARFVQRRASDGAVTPQQLRGLVHLAREVGKDAAAPREAPTDAELTSLVRSLR